MKREDVAPIVMQYVKTSRVSSREASEKICKELSSLEPWQTIRAEPDDHSITNLIKDLRASYISLEAVSDSIIQLIDSWNSSASSCSGSCPGCSSHGMASGSLSTGPLAYGTSNFPIGTVIHESFLTFSEKYCLLLNQNGCWYSCDGTSYIGSTFPGLDRMKILPTHQSLFGDEIILPDLPNFYIRVF